MEPYGTPISSPLRLRPDSTSKVVRWPSFLQSPSPMRLCGNDVMAKPAWVIPRRFSSSARIAAAASMAWRSILVQVLYFARLLAGHHVTTGVESGPKMTRAMPVASQVEAGNLAIVRGPWNRAFLDELRDFPNGAKD